MEELIKIITALNNLDYKVEAIEEEYLEENQKKRKGQKA
jgi:hypothetical protein